MGAHLPLRVNNAFILPTILFVAQLQQPPQQAYAAEQKAPGKIVAGRGGWCKAKDLTHLHNIGAPTEMRDLHNNAKAAMIRTVFWENSTEGGINWKRMAQDLQHAMDDNTQHLVRNIRKKDWHTTHFPTCLQPHINQLNEVHEISPNTIRDAIANNQPLPLPKHLRQKWRRNAQRWIQQ